jgi:hypothetical protein
MAKSVLDVHKFAKALADAGILHEKDLNSITRIVIDADANDMVLKIHVTRIGDDPEKIAEAVAPVLKGVLDG